MILLKKGQIYKQYLKTISTALIKAENYSYGIFLLIVIYTIFFSTFTIYKHISYNSYAWDLGIFSQAFWSLVETKFTFIYTCELHLVESGNFYGIHFSPILNCLVPIFSLSPRPETLLITQSFILGIASLPVYLIGKNIIHPKFGFIAATLYLLNPIIHGINSYDFHVQIFIPFFSLASIYYYVNNNWKAFIISTTFLLYIEEHLVYVLLFYMIFVMIDNNLFHKKPKKNNDNLITSLCIIIYFTFLVAHWYQISSNVIKLYNPVINPILGADRHFNVLGIGQPDEIPFLLLKDPANILKTIKYAFFEKVKYLFFLTAPFLFLSFVEVLALLPTIPWIVVFLLSNYSPYYSIGYQYPSYVLPFIIYSAIRGTSKIKNTPLSEIPLFSKKNFFRLLLFGNILFFSLVSPSSPFSGTPKGNPAYLNRFDTTHLIYIKEILEKIPIEASILTQDNIFPHISTRSQSFVLPPPVPEENFTFAQATTCRMKFEPQYIAIDPMTDLHGSSNYLLINMENYEYRLVEVTDNIFLFKLDNESNDVFPTSYNTSIIFHLSNEGGKND